MDYQLIIDTRSNQLTWDKLNQPSCTTSLSLSLSLSQPMNTTVAENRKRSRQWPTYVNKSELIREWVSLVCSIANEAMRLRAGTAAHRQNDSNQALVLTHNVSFCSRYSPPHIALVVPSSCDVTAVFLISPPEVLQIFPQFPVFQFASFRPFGSVGIVSSLGGNEALKSQWKAN